MSSGSIPETEVSPVKQDTDVVQDIGRANHDYEVCSEHNGNFRFLKKIFIYSSTLMLSPSK